jgi:hypothetical protein
MRLLYISRHWDDHVEEEFSYSEWAKRPAIANRSQNQSVGDSDRAGIVRACVFESM